MFDPDRKKSVWALLGILILTVAAIVWRLNALAYDFHHPDEIIATSVVERVLGDKTVDTNWARTNLPQEFRRNQFNFSTYYLFAAGSEAVAAFFGAPASTSLIRLRVTSAVLGGVVVLLAGVLAVKLGGSSAGVTASLLAAVCVTLFQDSLYARPESFTSVLLLVMLLLCTSSKLSTTWRLSGAGLLLGALIATKVTFLVLIPFPLIAAALQERSGNQQIQRAFVYGAGLIVGFALGAPYALLHPLEYLEGVRYLTTQYGSGLWPHGLHDSTVSSRLQHSGSYLSFAIGLPVMLLAGIGFARLLAERNFPVVTLVAGVAMTAIYFLQSQVFFERNLSHALPVLFVLSGLGTSEIARRIGAGSLPRAAVAALLAVAVAWQPAQVTGKLVSEALPRLRADEIRSFEEKLKSDGDFLIDVSFQSWEIEPRIAGVCGPLVFKVVDFGDRYTASVLDSSLMRGRLEVRRRIAGPFHGAPPSTLQTYHAADLVYLGLVDLPAQDCPLRFEPMHWPHPVDGTEFAARLSGAATRNGLPAGVPSAPWRRPTYSTWSGADHNSGEVSFGPLRACRQVLFPVMHGPQAEGTGIKIVQLGETGWNTVFEGPVPSARDHWVLVRLSAKNNECRSLWVTAYDRGLEWGQWIGIGEPVLTRD